MTRPTSLFPVLVATGALLFGGAAYAVAHDTVVSAKRSTTLHLSADAHGKLRFSTSHLTAHPGSVTLVMRNPTGAGMPHGIAVEGKGVDRDGRVVKPGGTSTVRVTLKRGTYEYYCPVSGHKQAGMEGKLVVR